MCFELEIEKWVWICSHTRRRLYHLLKSMLAVSICSQIPKHTTEFNKNVRKNSTHTLTTASHRSCWLLHLWSDSILKWFFYESLGSQNEITSISLFEFYHLYRFAMRSQGPILNLDEISTILLNQFCDEYNVILIRFNIRHAWIWLVPVWKCFFFCYLCAQYSNNFRIKFNSARYSFKFSIEKIPFWSSVRRCLQQFRNVFVSIGTCEHFAPDLKPIEIIDAMAFENLCSLAATRKAMKRENEWEKIAETNK